MGYDISAGKKKVQFLQSLCATCRQCTLDKNGKPYCDARRWWQNMRLYYIAKGRKQCNSYLPNNTHPKQHKKYRK